MIIVKTPGFQVGSTTAAEEGGEVKGGGRGERGERRGLQFDSWSLVTWAIYTQRQLHL